MRWSRPWKLIVKFVDCLFQVFIILPRKMLGSYWQLLYLCLFFAYLHFNSVFLSSNSSLSCQHQSWWQTLFPRINSGLQTWPPQTINPDSQTHNQNDFYSPYTFTCIRDFSLVTCYIRHTNDHSNIQILHPTYKHYYLGRNGKLSCNLLYNGGKKKMQLDAVQGSLNRVKYLWYIINESNDE